MNVILYSTNCPQCKMLEMKLKQKNISYEEITDVALMQEKGFMSVPKLEVDGTIYDLKDAVKWVGGQ